MSIKADRIIAVRTSKTVYRDGDTVLKVFDGDYPKSDVLSEALNQARVEEAGVCVPKLLEVMKLDDKWAIRSEYVPGETLQQLMDRDRDNCGEYLGRFVDIQLEICSHRAPLLNKLKDKLLRRIAESTLDATTRYELRSRLSSMPEHQKICHGDFNPSNIVVKTDGSCCVLDWFHASQGNASADAARTYLLFWLAGDIATAESYLKLFCKKSDTAKQYVQQWMPIVAAAQSVGCRPQEREFLLQWANVFDYE